MCGIVGYTGCNKAAPILLAGLSKLEYRGYDSAGIAVRSGSQPPHILKAVGKLRALEELAGRIDPAGRCGIGHTRWATHGAPNLVNAHPHISGYSEGTEDERPQATVTGVHNGIIENHHELEPMLEAKGYRFYSDTDTEAAVKLVDMCYGETKDPVLAIVKAMEMIKGSYALELIFRNRPGEIWVARKESPVIIGLTDSESFIASDITAILEYTKSVYYMDDYEFAKVFPGGATFYDREGNVIKKEATAISWDAKAAGKNGYEHYMLKEIYEQPRAVSDTLRSLVRRRSIDPNRVGLTREEIRSISQLCIVACGSAWHVGMNAQYVIEGLSGIPVRTELASEFRYRDPALPENSLVVLISQSGETADTLAALRLAKSRGIKTLAVVNVIGSTIAREADSVIYTLAGPEISVATTKAYSAQLAVMYCLALLFAKERGRLDKEGFDAGLSELLDIPAKMGPILRRSEEIRRIAEGLRDSRDVFFIGRGTDYSVCLEGSLKLKEISYIHSEAYAAGELKHGTISLIEEGTPVIAVVTRKDISEKTLSNMVEVKSRGARLICVAAEDIAGIEDICGEVIRVADAGEWFSASLAVLPLQLLAYYVSAAKGLDVDKPRNLAKSVTVE